MVILELTHPQCLEVIRANRVARLACARDGQPYVVPIYYAFAAGHFHSFTLPGKKLEWMRENPKVCLQIDDHTPDGWRSVVVDGSFEELPDLIGHKHAREQAWQLLSAHADWWEPGGVRPGAPPRVDHANRLFYRISIDRVSGREARAEISR